MQTRNPTTTTLLIVLIVIFTFPVWIGILGGLFGIVMGLFGAAFGIVGAIFGIVFGGIGSLFGSFFHWSWHPWHFGFLGAKLFWFLFIVVLAAILLKPKSRIVKK